ncbi:hypothetical protein EVG20_g11257 [Dentipellis fragilis]|uniref:Ubiquitin thioesterase OTU n=1 Tax=Dentipellis fragilis TaxID=205917 RepID=A0A4Y9XQV8_9AGAM|nr:hypothetical protein EVG20_g11257 [Dentipellis fragilis]
MAPVRLRHPKGVSTLQVDFDSTVLDLQQQIFSVSEIPPSAQDLKTGYPPKPLTGVIPDLPVSSLGLVAGDQLIVTQKAGAGSAPPPVHASTRPPLPHDPGANIINPPASIPASHGAFSDAFGASPSAGVNAGAGDGPDYVPTDGGYLVHRIVPDDNSCLFSSVALVFEQDMSKAPKIRQLVADAIRNDAETWSEVILGRPRNDYISTILSPNSWGGAIELSIVAAHYRTEIASIDVETGRVDYFSPPAGQATTGNRVLLIYSGIHYDAAVIAPEVGAPAEWCMSIVPVVGEGDSDPMIAALKKLAEKLRAKKAYTNTATFDLKCEICGKGLKGEKEARSHASETGHTSFGEF